jgi:acyl carrier protein
MSRQDIVMELEKLMEVGQGTLTGNEILDNLPAWDSMTILACIEVFHQRTGVVLDGEKVSRAKTIDELIHLVLGASEPVENG